MIDHFCTSKKERDYQTFSPLTCSLALFLAIVEIELLSPSLLCFVFLLSQNTKSLLVLSFLFFGWENWNLLLVGGANILTPQQKMEIRKRNFKRLNFYTGCSRNLQRIIFRGKPRSEFIYPAEKKKKKNFRQFSRCMMTCRGVETLVT